MSEASNELDSDLRALRRVTESWWFKAISRGAMIAAMAISGWAGWTLNQLNNGIAEAKTAAAVVAAEVVDHAEAIADAQRDIDSIRVDMSRVRQDVVQIKVDVGTIKGLLLRSDLLNPPEPTPVELDLAASPGP